MLKTILKSALAGAILYWLISQGKLDFKLVLRAIENTLYFLIGAALIIVQLTIGAFRLHFLLSIKSTTIKAVDFIKIQWIGQMFSTFLPGAFTSDLLKVGYIRKLDNSLSKSYIVFAILFDRIIGLNSILFISGSASLIFYKDLININLSIKNIILINILLFLISLLGMSLIFLNDKIQNLILKIIPSKKLVELVQEIWKLKAQKKKMLWAYFASILGHLFSILAFWVVNLPFFESSIEFKYLATLIPLGQLAVVIPISPGGIGVGHAAFSSLFGFIGHSNGASLYNVYWVMCLVVSLFGIFPFILNKKKH